MDTDHELIPLKGLKPFVDTRTEWNWDYKNAFERIDDAINTCSLEEAVDKIEDIIRYEHRSIFPDARLTECLSKHAFLIAAKNANVVITTNPSYLEHCDSILMTWLMEKPDIVLKDKARRDFAIEINKTRYTSLKGYLDEDNALRMAIARHCNDIPDSRIGIEILTTIDLSPQDIEHVLAIMYKDYQFKYVFNALHYVCIGALTDKRLVQFDKIADVIYQIVDSGMNSYEIRKCLTYHMDYGLYHPMSEQPSRVDISKYPRISEVLKEISPWG